MKKITFILCIIFFNSAFSGLTRPHKDAWYSDVDLSLFSWMIKGDDKVKLIIFSTEDLEKILPKAEIERFVKLKMRNFIRQIKLSASEDKDFHTSDLRLYITLDVVEYNESGSIYYGLIDFTLTNSTPSTNDYSLTIRTAGSKKQIIPIIKEDLGRMIETFAEEFYYMEDLVDKKAKKN